MSISQMHAPQTWSVFFVITGGPASWKEHSHRHKTREGYTRTVDAGRAIIQDQVAISATVLPWSDPPAFAEVMLCWEMRSYRIAREQDGIVFFDRGVPYVVGYLRLMALPVPEYMDNASKLFRYNRRVWLNAK